MTFEEVFQKAVDEHTKEVKIMIIDVCIELIEKHKFSPEATIEALERLKITYGGEIDNEY